MYEIFCEIGQQKKTESRDGKKVSDILEAEVFKNLSKQEQDEFYGMCRKLKIDKFDTEMFRLMLIFQYHKMCLTEVPEKIEKLKNDLEQLAETVQQNAEESEKHLDRIRYESEPIDYAVSSLKTNAQEVVKKASLSLSNKFTETMEEAKKIMSETIGTVREAANRTPKTITDGVNATLANTIKEALPIAGSDAHKSFMKAIEENRQAAELLRENALNMRRSHYIAYVLAAIGLIIGGWAYTYSHYEIRLSEAREAAIRQIGENRAVLIELGKSNHKIELTTNDKGHRLLVMKDAIDGWISTDKHGVIEFK